MKSSGLENALNQRYIRVKWKSGLRWI